MKAIAIAIAILALAIVGCDGDSSYTSTSTVSVPGDSNTIIIDDKTTIVSSKDEGSSTSTDSSTQDRPFQSDNTWSGGGAEADDPDLQDCIANPPGGYDASGVPLWSPPGCSCESHFEGRC